MIGGTLQIKSIRAHWDEILRLATSIKQGTVTASLMLRKLGSYPRQNGLAVALRELGRIERTLFILDWLQSVELRRRVHMGLNKGEARNALARAVFFYRLGEIRDRSFEQQQYRASGLTLATAAIALWNTVYRTSRQRSTRKRASHGPGAPETLVSARLGAHQPYRGLSMAEHRKTRQEQVQISAPALTYDMVRFLKGPLIGAQNRLNQLGCR
jgi:Tn3 transposase DDE domain